MYCAVENHLSLFKIIIMCFHARPHIGGRKQSNSYKLIRLRSWIGWGTQHASVPVENVGNYMRRSPSFMETVMICSIIAGCHHEYLLP